MRVTTENQIGHVLFESYEDAENFVAEMASLADEAENFVISPYQGGRFHVARFYDGSFEAYC